MIRLAWIIRASGTGVCSALLYCSFIHTDSELDRFTMSSPTNNDQVFVLKSVILGVTDTGKTCLLRRFIYKTFGKNEAQVC